MGNGAHAQTCRTEEFKFIVYIENLCLAVSLKNIIYSFQFSCLLGSSDFSIYPNDIVPGCLKHLNCINLS